MSVGSLIRTIFMVELIKGLGLTLKVFIKGLPGIDRIVEQREGRKTIVTRQYPEEPRESMPGFRGLHALVRDPETRREKCIACGLCAAVCPSKCIYIHSSEEDSSGKKVALRYEIEVLRCVYCAFCVEACPVGAVVLTQHYEYADYGREPFYMTKEKLLENWDTHMAGKKAGSYYLNRFWRPKQSEFKAYPGQAVLRKGASGGDTEAAGDDEG